MEMVSVEIMMQLMNLKQRQLEMLTAVPSAQIMEGISNLRKYNTDIIDLGSRKLNIK
jgi:hypothetical protein